MKSVQGNKACQMFVTKFGGGKVYPLNNKVGSHMELFYYFKVVDMPTSLHIDKAKLMDLSKKWKKFIAS